MGRQCGRCDMGPSAPPSLMMKGVTSYPMRARCGGSRGLSVIAAAEIAPQGLIRSANFNPPSLPPLGCCAWSRQVLGRLELANGCWLLSEDRLSTLGLSDMATPTSHVSDPRRERVVTFLVVATRKGQAPSVPSTAIAVGSRVQLATHHLMRFSRKSKCSSFCRKVTTLNFPSQPS